MANPQPTDAHLRIAHSINEELMMRDFSKRQRSILDFVLRLSWGCGKHDAIIPMLKDFELCGVPSTKIKAEIEYLAVARVIVWDVNTNRFWFNKDYDQWKISIVKGYDKERLKDLVGINLDTSQNGNIVPEKGIDFPKQEETSQLETGSDFPKQEVEGASNPHGSKAGGASKENILNKSIISLDDFFETIWSLYPKREGKGQVSKTQKERLYKIGIDEMTRAINRYIKAKSGKDKQYLQNGSTFFNSGYVDYMDKNYKEIKEDEQSLERPPGWVDPSKILW